MREELRSQIEEYTKELIAAPSCCEEAKAAGQAFLAAAGTDAEDAAAKALVKELEEDVCSIDSLIELASSEAGRQIFGDGAEAAAEAAKKAKAEGERYCTCDACQAGAKILAKKAEI